MTLEQIEQRLSALKEEQDKLTAELERLKAEQAEVKPWRAEEGENYYHIGPRGNIFVDNEILHTIDDELYNIGNYYRTRELAEQNAKELALRGRVRQLRDALCEGYQFVHNRDNYYIFFKHSINEYMVGVVGVCQPISEIYFDTREHAQQACDILNAELSNG